MTRSHSKYQRDYELRRRASGYRRIGLWVHADDADRVHRFARALERARRKTEVPVP